MRAAASASHLSASDEIDCEDDDDVRRLEQLLPPGEPVTVAFERAAVATQRGSSGGGGGGGSALAGAAPSAAGSRANLNRMRFESMKQQRNEARQEVSLLQDEVQQLRQELAKNFADSLGGGAAGGRLETGGGLTTDQSVALETELQDLRGKARRGLAHPGR